MVATPVRPSQHPFLAACKEKLKSGFPTYNPGWHFDFQDTSKNYREGRTRLQAISAARNELIERIDGHDYVLMMDSDLVMTPFGLPTMLWEANPEGITAPLILLEGTNHFYDTSGFIEKGHPVLPSPPFFTQKGDFVPLDSVGTAYLVPASVYENARYPEDPSWLTDHWEFCQEAKKQGVTVGCLTTTAAYHAILPLYGEQWRAAGY